MYVIVNVNNGATSVTTPIPLDSESSLDAAKRIQLEMGGEILLASTVDALTKQVGSFISTDVFRERLMPAYIRIPSARQYIVDKWDRIIRDYMPTSRTTPVNLSSPATIALVNELVIDGVLLQEEADNALSIL